MSTTLKHAGHYVPHVAAAAIVAGEVIGPRGTGEKFGVATNAIADTETGELSISGVHELAAEADDVWADGDILYWDAADANLTDLADTGTNKQAGIAVGAKAATVTKARVLLNGLPGPGAGY